jgi:hypothetical protein
VSGRIGWRRIEISKSIGIDVLTFLCSLMFSKFHKSKIQIALSAIFEYFEKIAYTYSYKREAKDKETLIIAEEGMDDYASQLEK